MFYSCYLPATSNASAQSKEAIKQSNFNFISIGRTIPAASAKASLIIALSMPFSRSGA